MADTPIPLLTEALQEKRAQSEQGEHLVLLLDQFPKVLGGGERVVLRLARLLHGAGYRVSIVTFQAYCDPDLLESLPCPIYLLPLDNVFSMAALRAAWQLGRFLRREKVGIVMTFFESSNLFGGIATKALSRARLIWNRRDMGILREPKHRLAYRLLPWLPDYVIAVSEEVRRHAMEVDRIPKDRVGVVYNGLDRMLQAVAEKVWPTAPVILTVGNIRPVKGHDVLVEAAGLLLRDYPAARIQIAGEVLDTAFHAKLQQRVADLAITDRLQFLGNVADPRALLSQASVFVLPSRSEGFSNAIVEAMMAGLPVVATTVGGNAEAVVDAETGLLVPPDRPEALAAALRQLLDDPEQMRQMGEAGRERAEAHFTSESMVHRLLEIFRFVRN